MKKAVGEKLIEIAKRTDLSSQEQAKLAGYGASSWANIRSGLVKAGVVNRMVVRNAGRWDGKPILRKVSSTGSNSSVIQISLSILGVKLGDHVLVSYDKRRGAIVVEREK